MTCGILKADIPKGNYTVTESTHHWFSPGYNEKVNAPYLQENLTGDPKGNDDYYYWMKFVGDDGIELTMSTHGCNELGDITIKGTYQVTGNTVTFKFSDGSGMKMR